MKRTVQIDPFFDKQPEKTFLQDLIAPVHSHQADFFHRRIPNNDEILCEGMYLADRFDGDNLETVYQDFNLFLQVHQINGNRFPVRFEKCAAACPEAWQLYADPSGVCIRAQDSEGVRRALIWMEDEMLRREGPFLPVGTTARKPSIRTRITRCFFSPINRPPKYGDELSDDIDYYPEEYLNRLMHDGVNGVWIYTRFSDLVTVDALPDYGVGRERRIEKLNRVIERCAKYGIRVYVFAIEPVALSPEQSQKLPQADGGVAWNERHLFCVHSPEGRSMIREAGARLFASCPKLGGLISITYGERPTSCASAYSCIPEIGYESVVTCPRCKAYSPGQIVADAAQLLAEGVRTASPDAEVISWTYGHRFWPINDVCDYVRHAPSDVSLMQNFEEMGYAEQLGKTRLGVDYWLSYTGPSPLFRETALEAMKQGKEMFMKIQACCSHEVASVPYVPVPGILFDKYKAARALNVRGVMQSWYFGNYPSLMSKAAGELSFMHDFDDKKAFLTQLAGSLFGQNAAQKVVKAWQKFEEAYQHYPLNIMFSYYGPMHDGPVWKLHLLPKNFSLPRSWQTLDPIDGDRIGECLLEGHTLDEAILLTGKMSALWHLGVTLLEDAVKDKTHEQLSVAHALDILFASGHAILRFYALREKLGLQQDNASDILAELKSIVQQEMERSRQLMLLCANDGRLGYHSEGEGYKFFPEKLRDRISHLEKLLETEFKEVEQRIALGKAPLAYYLGEETDDSVVYRLCSLNSGNAEWSKIGENAAFRAFYDPEHLTFEIRSSQKEWVQFSAEFRLMWPSPPITIQADGEIVVEPEAYLYSSVFGDKLKMLRDHCRATSVPVDEGMLLRLELDRSAIGWKKETPLKCRIVMQSGASWAVEDEPTRTLGKSSASPGEYGWLLPSP